MQKMLQQKFIQSAIKSGKTTGSACREHAEENKE